MKYLFFKDWVNSQNIQVRHFKDLHNVANMISNSLYLKRTVDNFDETDGLVYETWLRLKSKNYNNAMDKMKRMLEYIQLIWDLQKQL